MLTRTDIKGLLSEFDLVPSRALGQNFLCEPSMVSKIVRLAGVSPSDRVVEIGPGLGSLTLGLCEAGAQVKAIELDRHIIQPLTRVLDEGGCQDQVQIFNVDATDISWDEVLRGESHKVVANLPYNIATTLILKLLVEQPLLDEWLVMIQKEAGERLVAGPGSRTYGIPSVLLSFWAEAKIVANVPAELFLPKPNVESVLVKIVRKSPPEDVDFDRLVMLVKAGFNQRRKMLRRSLNSYLSEDQIIQAGIDPTNRAEVLDLDQWIVLSKVV